MKRLLSKRNWLIGLVVLSILLLGGGTAVLAYSGDGSASTHAGVYLDSSTVGRLASVLGLTPEDLTSQLQTGKTLASIAQELNIPTATLTETIIAPYADQVALRVKYGYITQDQADALIETARQHAASLLEQDLSSIGSNSDWQQQMADNCANIMNAYGGAIGHKSMMDGFAGIDSGMMSGGRMGSGMMSGGRMGGGMMSGGRMGGGMMSGGRMGGGMMGRK